MSSTAILISGQFRTFEQCLPTQHWHVYRHFPDCHFFLVMQKTVPGPHSVDSEAMVKLLEGKYGKDKVHAKLIDDPTGLPMIPKKFGFHAPYENAAPHPQLMMQHWYQNEVWKLFNEHATKFDVILRMRGDNFFHSFTMAPQPLPQNIVYSPWFARFGGINDRFAVISPDGAAAAYFTVYEKIDELLKLGCPFHPEALLKAALEIASVVSDDKLMADFASYRVNGQHRHMETLPVDMHRR